MNLPEFCNEPYTDFGDPQNAHAMQEAQKKVRDAFGQEYELMIGGRRVRTDDKLRSLNPSRPSELVGTLQKATPELAAEAIEAAAAFFPEWSHTKPEARVEMLLRAADLLRRREAGVQCLAGVRIR